MDTIKFSILIPAYKGKFLKKAVESIVNQTYKNWELIIVDDCSPHDLKSIVDSINDSRILFYRNEINYGAVDVVDNWNKCLSYASGDYVICMGDDDILLPDCLSIYEKLIYSYPDLDVYHGLTKIINEKGSIIDMQESRPLYESECSLIWHRWNGRRQYIGDFLFRTSKLKEVGGFYKLPLAWGSDDITAVNLAKRKGVANTQTPVFAYRMNTVNISKTGNPEIKLNAIEKEIRWYETYFSSILNNKQKIDEMSLIYLNLCRLNMGKYFLKKKIHILSEDMMVSFLRLFKWLRISKKYNISRPIVVYSFIKAIRNGVSLKYQRRNL